MFFGQDRPQSEGRCHMDLLIKSVPVCLKKKKIMIPAIASSLIRLDLLEGTARKPPEGFCSTPRPH